MKKNQKKNTLSSTTLQNCFFLPSVVNSGYILMGEEPPYPPP